jgi:hypothetical protein
MFIQVIEGHVRDPETLYRRLDEWNETLRPSAIGYLGSTGGCTSTGDCILVARFESREAAMRNSSRPEQDTWWQHMEECFDGPVTFHDSEDVQIMQHGSLDEATFVQAMDGHVTDMARAHEVEREADGVLAAERPDLLGSVTAFFDDGGFTELAYFTSEEAARAAEQAAMSPSATAAFEAWTAAMPVDRYLDLRDPRMMHA